MAHGSTKGTLQCNSITYLVIIDKNDDNGLTTNLLNGIEVAESVNSVEAAVDADTWRCPPCPDVSTRPCVVLQFPATGLAPLCQERLLVLVLLR